MAPLDPTDLRLLDEFQRFRTRDRKGNDVATNRYHDVWSLLSDGRLSPPMLPSATAWARAKQSRRLRSGC